MHRPLLLTLALAATLAAAPAWADRPAPPPPANEPAATAEAPLVVQKGRRAHILIPAKYVKNLRAEASAPEAPQFAGIPPRAILAGCAVALALAGGLALVRRPAFRLASALVVVLSVCALGGSAIADVPVDPPKKKAEPAARVVIEVAKTGDSVVFITP